MENIIYKIKFSRIEGSDKYCGVVKTILCKCCDQRTRLKPNCVVEGGSKEAVEEGVRSCIEKFINSLA